MRLRNKIHLISSATFAVILILMNALIYWLFSTMTTDSALRQTDAEATAIAEGLRRSAGALPENELLRAYVPIDGMLRLVAPGDRSRAAVTSSSESRLSLHPAAYYETKTVHAIAYEGTRYAMASIPVIWIDGSVMNVQVTASLEAVMERLAALRLVLLLVTAVALVPVAGSGWLLGRLIMRPIAKMTSTMQDIQRSGAFKRLRQEGRSRDELYAMGETFNRMIELLEANYTRQKQFVSNASHELMTPLTVIESYSSLLLRRGKERPELYEESLQAIHSEAIRLKEMTEQLLLLARDREQWNVQLEDTDLSALVEQSVRAFRSAYDRDIRVIAPSAPVSARTDGNKVKQLLYILLDNARKYSDGDIVVTLEQGPAPSISVQDRGIGIPKEQLDRVFDRFYRVDSARGRRNGGSGLGLSLARDIADAIGVRSALDSVEGAGTTARIEWSRVPDGK